MVLGAAVGATADLDPQPGEAGIPPQLVERGLDRPGEAPRARDPELAGVGAGARHRVAEAAGARQPEADRLQRAAHLEHAVRRHEADDQRLVRGDAQGVAAVLVEHRGEAPQLGGRQVAPGHPHGHGGVARLGLGEHRGAEPLGVIGAGRLGRGAAGLAQRLVRPPPESPEVADPVVVVGERRAHLLDLLSQPLDAPTREEELQPRPGPVLLLAVDREDPQQRLGERQQLLLGEEVGVLQRLVRDRAEAAPDHHPEAAPGGAVGPPHSGRQPQIVERAEVPERVVDSGQEDLELAAQALAVGVPQEVAGQLHAVGGDVERLGRADAGVGGRADVAHDVAARLLAGHLGAVEGAHHLGAVGQLHPVDLDVLAGGEVGDAVPVDLGDVREGAQLLGRHQAQGELAAHHVHAVLALPVDPHAEALLQEHVLGHRAVAEATDGGGESFDLGGDQVTGTGDGAAGGEGDQRHRGISVLASWIGVGRLWMPHSVLPKPAQRPARSSSSSVRGRDVQGWQPTDR